jgi:NADH-quinone oxidoreductase subunit G
LDKFAAHTFHYKYGEEITALRAFMPGSAQAAPETLSAAAQIFAGSENAVILFGSEGLDLLGSAALANTCAQILVKSGRLGRPNNGLVGVWANGNTQGAWDLGFAPTQDLAEKLAGAKTAWIAAADPAGDNLILAQALEKAGFVIVQELFLTETARRADIVFPAAAWTEREGSYTNGERRVQRFYPVSRPFADARPDFAIAADIGNLLGLKLEGRSPSLAFLQLCRSCADYAGLSYQALAEVTPQWPEVGRQDLYYGGSTYNNQQGLGKQLPNAAQRRETFRLPAAAPSIPLVIPEDGLLVVPITKLYDRGQLILFSKLLQDRLAKAILWLSPDTSAKFSLPEGSLAQVLLNGTAVVVEVHIDQSLQPGVGLIPRSIGLPVTVPAVTRLYPAVPAAQA